MAAKKSDNANVTRIKASTSAKKSKPSSKDTKVEANATPQTSRSVNIRTPKLLSASGGYLKGAWTELRQVRWPTRQATWSLTGAVLAFSAFFVVLILLLDAGFKLLFEKLLG